ncbi:MAG: HAD family phosphatase [bacterium]|nr:HAD family phosphatase [bacterium]
MAILGVAYDLEGTVVDLEDAHHQGHLQVMREVGMDLSLERAIKEIPHFIGGPHTKIIEEIFAVGNKTLTIDEIDRRDRAYFREYRATAEIKPRPGFLEVHHAFVARGLQVAIGSLTEREDAFLILDRSGLRALFPRECIVLAEDVTRVKPAPDVFVTTAERMGIYPCTQLVFEDSPNGVRAARAAGSLAVGMPVYDFSTAIIPLTEAGACRIFMDWHEVSVDNLLKDLEGEVS